MRFGSLLKGMSFAVFGLSLLASSAWAQRDHDGGFFMRISAGPGYASSSENLSPEVTLSGVSGDFNMAFGAVITENLAVHATIFGWNVVSPDVESGGVSAELSDTSLSLAAFGAGVTYYLGDSNFYVTGSAGAGKLSLDIDILGTVDSDVGFAADFAVGKEWWVSDKWGLGVALGGGFHSIPDSNSDLSLTGGSFGLRFSATMN